MSNRVLSSRVDGREAGDLNGVPVTRTVSGISGAPITMPLSGHEREGIDGSAWMSLGVHLVVLPAHTGTCRLTSPTWRSFPGIQLAKNL